PTWSSAGSVDAPAWPCTGWGLPGRHVAVAAVRSYRTFSPLPALDSAEAQRLGGLFLWHFPAAFAGSVPRPPCPAVSGLSSRGRLSLRPPRGCLAGSPHVLGPIGRGVPSRRNRVVLMPDMRAQVRRRLAQPAPAGAALRSPGPGGRARLAGVRA